MKTHSPTSPLRLPTHSSGALTPRTSGAPLQSHWRQRGVGLLRIAFGMIWAIDAWFKWQPAFQGNFLASLMGAQDGQPAPIHTWIGFWALVVRLCPFLFVHLEALGETAIAIGLLLGLFSNLTNIAGVLLSLLIWSTAEGFGGPYGPGATDIGTAIIYAIAFVGLFLTSSGRFLAVDQWLTPRLGRWSFLASGPVGFKRPLAAHASK